MSCTLCRYDISFKLAAKTQQVLIETELLIIRVYQLSYLGPCGGVTSRAWQMISVQRVMLLADSSSAGGCRGWICGAQITRPQKAEF